MDGRADEDSDREVELSQRRESVGEDILAGTEREKEIVFWWGSEFEI